VPARIRYIAALLLVAVLAGCGPAPVRDAPLKVVASIAPLADWARRVGGAYVSVQMLVPPDIDPRDYVLDRRQRDAILKADVVLMNGLGLEPWIEDVLAEARNSNLIVVEMAQFTGPLTERVLRKRAVEPDQAMPEPRSGTDDQLWAPAPVYSPYLWLDIASAKAQVGLIAQMLARAEPDGIVDFQQNAARYTGELENLDIALFRQIDGWRWRTVLSTSRFLFPFTRHHDLSISIYGVPRRRGGPPIAQPLFVDALAGPQAPGDKLRGRRMVLLNPLDTSDYIQLMQTTAQSMTMVMAGSQR
jgi:ABC-type Zn uptake system ZnuABC Zn-binding protein ZnuA